MNNLYKQIGNQSNPMQDFINRFNQFKQSFTGDPKQQVQQLLNSGRMSQAQFNQLNQMAQQIQQMMGKK